jgi:hypothetical protein
MCNAEVSGALKFGSPKKRAAGGKARKSSPFTVRAKNSNQGHAVEEMLPEGEWRYVEGGWSHLDEEHETREDAGKGAGAGAGDSTDMGDGADRGHVQGAGDRGATGQGEGRGTREGEGGVERDGTGAGAATEVVAWTGAAGGPNNHVADREQRDTRSPVAPPSSGVEGTVQVVVAPDDGRGVQEGGHGVQERDSEKDRRGKGETAHATPMLLRLSSLGTPAVSYEDAFAILARKDC